MRSGKVRYVGVSNFVGWQLQKAALLAGDAARIVTLQPQYNLLGAAGLHLSEEEAKLLDDASAPLVADYPYGAPGIDQRSRHVPSE